jgi:hypothetical protein
MDAEHEWGSGAFTDLLCTRGKPMLISLRISSWMQVTSRLEPLWWGNY